MCVCGRSEGLQGTEGDAPSLAVLKERQDLIKLIVLLKVYKGNPPIRLWKRLRGEEGVEGEKGVG